MARVIFITGGSRSGKSSYAQKRAEALPGPRAYLATCPVLDDEMALRCRKHQEARSGADWDTIEEEINLAGVLKSCRPYSVILVDCLTLWINNLIYEAGRNHRTVTEDDIAEECRALLDACALFPGTLIFVSNEVGMGIVPDNALGRQFRDNAGRCNQIVAAAADEVIVLISGIPWCLKKDEKDEATGPNPERDRSGGCR
ncbi:MAG: bifunctional adenosylcobinamide kinase/adenosylcobinamide-phosphate guanylyltransferase [Syntrophaceae bacterium]|nr:bifunctional adenosylcobinamide kinase/adenosylcobinamide-phosphate guanylyltransferase [Syntrophaceae bacterium]